MAAQAIDSTKQTILNRRFELLVIMINRQIIKYFSFFLGFSLAAFGLTALAQQHHHSHEDLETTSPYVEQLDSSVRGLSDEEVSELLNGKGAGYARMAELNGYPGPRHILDLRSQLNLSTQQTKEIQAVFEQMQSRAKSLGQIIIAKEQQLSDAFASGSINSTELEKDTNQLGQLYGKLRKTHLQAHLSVTPLLSSEQIQKYNEIRGYKLEK